MATPVSALTPTEAPTAVMGGAAAPGNVPGGTPTANGMSPHALLWSAFTIIVAALLFLGVMMYWVMNAQLKAEERGLNAAMAVSPPNHAAAMAYTRAITASVSKTSSLYLAFLLIFVGGVYVLMPGSAVYKVTGEDQGVKGSLESNSPGLIIITLGIVLAITAIVTKSDVSYSESVLAPANATAAPSGAGERTDFTTPPSLGK